MKDENATLKARVQQLEQLQFSKEKRRHQSSKLDQAEKVLADATETRHKALCELREAVDAHDEHARSLRALEARESRLNERESQLNEREELLRRESDQVEQQRQSVLKLLRENQAIEQRISGTHRNE